MSLLLKAMWRREGCISFKSIISVPLAIDNSLYSSLEEAGKDQRAPAYIKASSHNLQVQTLVWARDLSVPCIRGNALQSRTGDVIPSSGNTSATPKLIASQQRSTSYDTTDQSSELSLGSFRVGQSKVHCNTPT